MNLDKALQILGLTRNFTEQELKKAYRTLITKYHPDRYETKSQREKKEAEEKTKEINVAKEFLEKHLKGNTSNQRTNTYKNNSSIDLIIKKEQLKNIINNMKNELATITNILFNDILKNARDKILAKLNTELTYIDSIYSILLFQAFEASHYTNIAKILEEFEKDYCKKYNISLGNKKLERYSLKKLYEELEQLKREQNAFSVEEILDKELNKYVYYAGYTVIKDLIENIKQNIIKKNSIVRESRDKIENEFNEKVLEEFKAYYKRLQVLEEYKSQNITNSRLKKIIQALEANIAKPETFKYFETQLINALADILIENIVEEPVIYNNSEKTNNIKKEEYIKNKELINNKYYQKIRKKLNK